MLVLMLLVVTAVIFPAAAQDAASAEVDLGAIKSYLLGKTADLEASTNTLYQIAQQYYDMAQAADFDYAVLAEQPDAVAAFEQARDVWIVASPLYEQMEGIVAGVSELADYDVILDAGASGEEDPVDGVQFDITLADGRVLARPGNLFGVTEATLWATKPEYSSGVWVDLNGDGVQDFDELLPDANVLLGGTETLHRYAVELADAADAWQPTESDAFTALVIMIPTMDEYFGSWKELRFVAGNEATRTDFVAISRLSDIQDILGGLQIVYEGVAPHVAAAGGEYESQIRDGLASLYSYVADLYQQEQDGTVFTAEEADFYGSEAQDRAMEIAGQVTQAAALLDVPLAVD